MPEKKFNLVEESRTPAQKRQARSSSLPQHSDSHELQPEFSAHDTSWASVAEDSEAVRGYESSEDFGDSGSWDSSDSHEEVEASDLPKRKKRKKTYFLWASLQLIGELVLTAGIVAMLYVAWQLFYTDYTANKAQAAIVKDISQEFAAAPPAQDNDMTSFGDPAVTPVPAADGDKFGIIYIPRFGEHYARPLIQGTTTDILDTLGVGHYNNTQMPGEVGNFAVAGHRNTNGSVFDLVGELQPGDHFYVQTAEGYYRYTYRNSIYVTPSQGEVIDPVPMMPGANPTERIMTLTSCHPRYTDHERVIAYATFSGWRPADKGAPVEIAQAVAGNK